MSRHHVFGDITVKLGKASRRAMVVAHAWRAEGAQNRLGMESSRSWLVIKELGGKAVDRRSGETAAKPLFHSLLAPRCLRLATFLNLYVYISGSIVGSRARQKQLAKFKIVEILFAL
jgi:hypothetical protein